MASICCDLAIIYSDITEASVGCFDTTNELCQTCGVQRKS